MELTIALLELLEKKDLVAEIIGCPTIEEAEYPAEQFPKLIVVELFGENNPRMFTVSEEPGPR